MRGRYVEMHRELVDARRIHESLFPAPTCEGNISVRYAYEPMRQIGGDYLFCKHTLAPAGNQRLNMVMLDVTGHGIPRPSPSTACMANSNASSPSSPTPIPARCCGC